MQIGEDGLVTKELNGVRVLFDDVPAPLLSVSAGRTNAVTPYSVLGKFAVIVRVENAGISSVPQYMFVRPASPSVFSNEILNEDGSANSANNPAPAGSLLVIYGTGMGQTSPPGLDGAITQGPDLPRPLLPVRAQFGPANVDVIDAEVIYAGPAAGFVSGVFQMKIRIPSGLRSGANPLLILVGGIPSPAFDVFIK
jgi:large repetitive protein